MSMKNLVVVESPSKTKKLSDFLGKGYKVVSSVGHIRDLPKSSLGVDVEHNFIPLYINAPDKKDVIRDLKKEAKTSDSIYLATDLDREGEAIAWHVAYVMNNDNDLKDESPSAAQSPSIVQLADSQNFQIAGKLKNSLGHNPKIYRVTFDSITKESVLDAFKTPRRLDMSLVDAQQARRVLDRLVGYKLSPLLWEKIRYGLSAGRVQSVAVRFIVEREREIKKFKKSLYFEIIGEFGSPTAMTSAIAIGATGAIGARLSKINGKSIYEKKKYDLFAGQYSVSCTAISSQQEADKILKDLKSCAFTVSKAEKKETRSHPSPPFTTASLQQSAASNLGYSPKRTMQIAQRLYEGGRITYMRTDSVNINPGFVKQVRNYINGEFGSKYLFNTERYYRAKKSARVQEAHEAVRPTSVQISAEKLPESVTPQERKLYDLIYRRTVATQMSPAVYSNSRVEIDGSKNEAVDKAKMSPNKVSAYTFSASGSILVFDGFLKVYHSKNRDVEIPDVKIGGRLNMAKAESEAKELTPPPRYNESSLVKELERFGIGRPSTYASIIDTIQARGYVKKEDKVLYPTDNGMVVNDLLAKHFPQIVDIDFTAEMEGNLDEVALGKLNWKKLIKDFYTPFEKLLIAKKKEIKKEDVVVLEKTKEKCPECKKGKLVVKLGKYGRFLSCEKFPDCQYARPIEDNTGEGNPNADQQKELDNLNEKCPECQGKLLVKTGRFGQFIACENYPKCKYTRKIDKKVGMKCPECGGKQGGEVVYKKTKKGRTFYGCSRYPDCKFASWTKPKK